MSRDRWPPTTFSHAFRGTAPAMSEQERWKRLLRHESSLAFRLTKAVTRIPVVGPRIGARPAAPSDWRPLADREAEIERVTSARLYRRIEQLRGSESYRRLWRRRDRTPAAAPAAPVAAEPAPPPPGPAPLGPVAAAHVDEALAFLRTVPFQEIQRRGWHLQPNHFYWPLNDVEFLDAHPELWHDRGLPAAIDWDVDGQVAFARDLAGVYDELADAARRPAANDMGGELTLANASFSGADACAYYGVVRTRKPRRVVEVGAGWSTAFLARAVERNGGGAHVTLIEPEPDRRLVRRIPSDWDVRPSLLQLADLQPFEQLAAGDVCFYDGSHCVRTASDVNWFFFEVLPRLAPGVLVHVHDIYLPDDYHDEWLLGDGLSWNEQYFLQAFLMHNPVYRVRLANHMLFRLREEAVRPLYPGWHDGSSLWLEKLSAG